MTAQFYWLVAAPGLLVGLSLFGWLALWLLPKPQPTAGEMDDADPKTRMMVRILRNLKGSEQDRSAFSEVTVLRKGQTQPQTAPDRTKPTDVDHTTD